MSLSKLLLTLKRLLCPHRTVQIRRVHPSVAHREGLKHALYLDDRGVLNYVVCACCGHHFKTDQKDQLFAQERPVYTNFKPVPALSRTNAPSLLAATEAEMAEWKAEVARLEDLRGRMQQTINSLQRW